MKRDSEQQSGVGKFNIIHPGGGSNNQTQIIHPLNMLIKYFIISIDLGYSYIKAVNERGEQIIFRSAASPVFDREIESVTGSENKTYHEDIVSTIVENELHVRILDRDSNVIEERLIGQVALESPEVVYTLDEEKLEHPNTKLFLATAASILSRGVNEPIYLTTSLPYDYYDAQKESYENYLKNFNVKVQHLSSKYNEIEHWVKFDRVSIFRQGTVSIYSYLMDTQCRPKNPQLIKSGETISVVNIGYHSVDVTTFILDKTGIKIQKKNSFTLNKNVGMVELRLKAEAEFYKQSGTHISLTRIEHMLVNENGKQTYKGKKIDIMPAYEAAKREVAETLMQQLSERYGSDKNFFHSVCFAGGGSKDLRDHLNDFHYKVEFSDHDQMDDAIGALIRTTLNLKAEERKALPKG